MRPRILAAGPGRSVADAGAPRGHGRLPSRGGGGRRRDGQRGCRRRRGHRRRRWASFPSAPSIISPRTSGCRSSWRTPCGWSPQGAMRRVDVGRGERTGLRQQLEPRRLPAHRGPAPTLRVPLAGGSGSRRSGRRMAVLRRRPFMAVRIRTDDETVVRAHAVRVRRKQRIPHGGHRRRLARLADRRTAGPLRDARGPAAEPACCWGGGCCCGGSDRVRELELFHVEEAVIETRRRVAVALDGEVVYLEPPLTYRIRTRLWSSRPTGSSGAAQEGG